MSPHQGLRPSRCLILLSFVGSAILSSCGGIARPDFSTGTGGTPGDGDGDNDGDMGGKTGDGDGDGDTGGTPTDRGDGDGDGDGDGSAGGTPGDGDDGGAGGTAGEGAGGGIGGAATGGTAGAGTGGTANPWRGGPCVATTDGLTWEAFGRGSDQGVYRKTESTDWSVLSDLDGSVVDNRSDLDCSATSTTVFISALGTQPLGSYIVATGFGASYNQFQQGIEIGSFDGSTGVAATTSTTFVASAVSQGRATVVAVSSSGETYYSLPPDSPELAGSTDITHFGAFTAAHTYLVGFDASNYLVVQKYTVTSHSQSWGDARLIPSPEGQFVHSPTVCHTRTTSGFPARHLVAATDTGIWYSVAEESTDDFSGWELMNDVVATSAPDCVALEDGTVHTVVLTAGGVADIHGTSGDFTLTDLGTY